MFGVTGVIAIAFVLWGMISTPSLGKASAHAQDWVITNTGWFFVLSSTFFVIFVIWLAASKYGRIPLGADGEKPEFRTVSWIAMMFSAGMGIGLMFWGVAEPLSHYAAPPPGTVDAQTDEAFQTAMATTMFHWALHPWAIYAVVGIAIAYGTFRKGRKQAISSAFIPLIGKKRAEGPAGRVIDILAIFATLFGSAASLGLGALQIGSGFKFNGWVDSVDKAILVVVIVVLTIAFIASAVSGVAKGIQWLSNINMVLALVLAVFVFVAGPTLLILNLLPTALGDYASQMTEMASRTAASGDDAMKDWLAGWTIFYWAWWVSWTPFVGMFIARISRGRTIRQFVTGVLIVPSLVSLVWFAVFGGTAIGVQRDTGSLIGKGGVVDTDSALFQMLNELPIASITTVLVMVLVGIFFVSGADAASIVMGSLSERGADEPSKRTVVFWGSLTGAVAAIMLVIGGDEALTGLQNITVVAAVPFVLVMVALCVSLYKDLQTDPIVVHERLGIEMVEDAVATGVEEHDGDFVLVVEAADPSADKPADETSG
ncbi:BCCT family transporter [Aeromicrobium sp. UC242_57]|uniref:BCCT family transporter n=1 Tax=Aeromicrobium sp. UC242_57 TaxID=3374624 RepID=UPI0037A96565